MRALAIALFLAACHRAQPSVGSRTLTDGIHRSVALGHVRRVVSLAPSSTEIVYALGAGDILVGVDRFSDYPAAAQKLPQLGTDMQPSVERMIALRPDLVLLATTANAQRSLEGMVNAGLAVYVSRSDSLEEIYADILGIGRAIEREDAAHALVATLRARVAALPKRTPVSCAVIVWPSPLVVASRGSHVDDLLSAAGCKNVVDDSPTPYPTYSTERLVRRAPDVLFVGTHTTESTPLDAIKALKSIPAVENDRVHLVDGDLLFRPGPRVVDGIEALAKLLP